jgi:hypothetical protein
MTDEMAMRLLQATREQLHGKPTGEVKPFKIAEKAGVNPYSREYDTAIRYLLDHGYIERYQNEADTALGLYRVTNKGWKRFLATPNPYSPKLVEGVFSETQLPVPPLLGNWTSCGGRCLSGLLWVIVLIA